MRSISRRAVLKSIVAAPVMGIATPTFAQKTPDWVDKVEAGANSEWMRWDKINKVEFFTIIPVPEEKRPLNWIGFYQKGGGKSAPYLADDEIEKAFWYILDRVRPSAQITIDNPAFHFKYDTDPQFRREFILRMSKRGNFRMLYDLEFYDYELKDYRKVRREITRV